MRRQDGLIKLMNSIVAVKNAGIETELVSNTCPTFIRLGTPSGLRHRSTGVPSGKKGMSASGTMIETMPLLPWRPASLSPTSSGQSRAINTSISQITPAFSSGVISGVKIRTSMTRPPEPCGTLRLESGHLFGDPTEDCLQEFVFGTED